MFETCVCLWERERERGQVCNVLRHLWDLILLGVFVCKVYPVKVCLRVCNHFLDVYASVRVWVGVCVSVSQSVSQFGAFKSVLQLCGTTTTGQPISPHTQGKNAIITN